MVLQSTFFQKAELKIGYLKFFKKEITSDINYLHFSTKIKIKNVTPYV